MSPLILALGKPLIAAGFFASFGLSYRSAPFDADAGAVIGGADFLLEERVQPQQIQPPPPRVLPQDPARNAVPAPAPAPEPEEAPEP